MTGVSDFDRVPVDGAFLTAFKRKTESLWQSIQIDPTIYGFQMQRGTRWLPGLDEGEIAGYQADLGVQFPLEFKRMLSVMNGTDLPTVNVYGSCGEPHRSSVGVYSYPRDLSTVKRLMHEIHQDRAEITAVLLEQEFKLEEYSGLVPVSYTHLTLPTN